VAISDIIEIDRGVLDPVGMDDIRRIAGRRDGLARPAEPEAATAVHSRTDAGDQAPARVAARNRQADSIRDDDDAFHSIASSEVDRWLRERSSRSRGRAAASKSTHN